MENIYIVIIIITVMLIGSVLGLCAFVAWLEGKRAERVIKLMRVLMTPIAIALSICLFWWLRK